MNTNVSTRSKINLRQMTVIGLLSAVSIMLSMTPLGFIPIGPVNATIMHLPVIIGAIVEGPIVGAAIGLIFGVTSLIRAITAPTIVSFVFMNPIVALVPRVLMGVLSYYVYKLILKATKKVYLSGLVTGLIGSLMNTCGVLGLVYLLYADKYMHALGLSGSGGKVLFGLAVTNGIPEAVVAALVVSSIAVAFKKRKEG